MHLAVLVFAKNEAVSIPNLFAQLAQQSLFHRDDLTIDVHVVANGCTDNTAQSANEAAPKLAATNASLTVHDLEKGGKSRSWNIAVHEFIDRRAQLLLFVDSDIKFCKDTILDQLITKLIETPSASACSGYPVKDILLKDRKNILDRFSLAVSSESQAMGAINGSLYVVRAEAVSNVWLPDETPGEDGFLNAMLTTHGFTKSPEPGTVVSMPMPTHYYKAHKPTDFVMHERRMIVGTMINCWIFEHLWSLCFKEPAGPTIRDWNTGRPEWVEHLIQQRTRSKRWVISNDVTFGRLRFRKGEAIWRWPLRIAFGGLATLVTVVPAITANRRLKRVGAASTW